MADPQTLAAAAAPSMPVVYAFGSNGNGQLGLGHTRDISRPERCLFVSPPQTCDREMPDFSDCSPSSGQGRPSQRQGSTNVKKIVAGGNHTLLLTTDGRLFVTGRMDLTHYSPDDETSRSSSSLVFVEVTQIVSRLAISEGDVGAVPVVTDIAATWEASFAVIDSTTVVVWGEGRKGELGLGSDITSTFGQAKKIFEVTSAFGQGEAVEIVDIVGSMAHLVVLLSDGRVYGWGYCRKGQLGEQLKTKNVLGSPRNIGVGIGGEDLLPWVPERVVLGKDYTVFFKIGRRPVLWGDSSSFPGKGGDLQWMVEEHPLEEDDVVTSGWSSVHILSGRQSEQSLRGAGKNGHGQLPPASLPPVRMVMAGSEHCVALTRDNQVIAWGWGKHGNCGETLDKRGNVANRYNVIPLPTPDEGCFVKNVAAGCATSFVVCGKKDG